MIWGMFNLGVFTMTSMGDKLDVSVSSLLTILRVVSQISVRARCH